MANVFDTERKSRGLSQGGTFRQELVVTISSQKKAWQFIMADSKRNKQIKQNKIPRGKSIAQGGNPEQYYTENSSK